MFGFWKQRQPAGIDRSTLVPRIKHVNFVTALKERGIPADQMPPTEPLVADLLVTYAFDLPAMFRIASIADFDRLALRPPEARALAIANLHRQVPKIGTVGGAPLLRVVTGNESEACSLLVDSFWDDQASQVSGELVVAAVSRDVVLFCGRDTPDGLAKLRERAGQVQRQDPVHSLSRHLLTRRDGAWTLFQE